MGADVQAFAGADKLRDESQRNGEMTGAANPPAHRCDADPSARPTAVMVAKDRGRQDGAQPFNFNDE